VLPGVASVWTGDFPGPGCADRQRLEVIAAARPIESKEARSLGPGPLEQDIRMIGYARLVRSLRLSRVAATKLLSGTNLR